MLARILSFRHIGAPQPSIPLRMSDSVILGLSVVAAAVTFVLSVVAIVNADAVSDLAGSGFGFIFALLVSCLSFVAAQRSARQQKQIEEIVEILRIVELERGNSFSSRIGDEMREKLRHDALKRFVRRFRTAKDLVDYAVARSGCLKTDNSLSVVSAIENICNWATVFSDKKHDFVSYSKQLLQRINPREQRAREEATIIINLFRTPKVKSPHPFDFPLYDNNGVHI